MLFPPPQFLNARNFFIHYLFFKKIYHKIERFFIFNMSTILLYFSKKKNSKTQLHIIQWT
ncbi:hypothetical protein HanXRQr2_Chr11g0474681 [Helianthus annuus]|uniref:Uncharacterized protein n=1 Tax=Helianthus annuus TaxID=4232 RepID=A0A9K3HLK5_HELAN|nr:hypothetical protein HanXRQr2_Chr11g0474681 [Helianthus annuus]